MKPDRVGFILVLGVGIVAVSFSSVFIRLAQAKGMATLAIAAWRLTFACFVLLPLFEDALALGGAVCMAGYLMIGRKVRVGCSLVTYIGPVYATVPTA